MAQEFLNKSQQRHYNYLINKPTPLTDTEKRFKQHYEEQAKIKEWQNYNPNKPRQEQPAQVSTEAPAVLDALPPQRPVQQPVREANIMNTPDEAMLSSGSIPEQTPLASNLTRNPFDTGRGEIPARLPEADEMASTPNQEVLSMPYSYDQRRLTGEGAIPTYPEADTLNPSLNPQEIEYNPQTPDQDSIANTANTAVIENPYSYDARRLSGEGTIPTYPEADTLNKSLNPTGIEYNPQVLDQDTIQSSELQEGIEVPVNAPDQDTLASTPNMEVLTAAPRGGQEAVILSGGAASKPMMPEDEANVAFIEEQNRPVQVLPEAGLDRNPFDTQQGVIPQEIPARTESPTDEALLSSGSIPQQEITPNMEVLTSGDNQPLVEDFGQLNEFSPSKRDNQDKINTIRSFIDPIIGKDLDTANMFYRRLLQDNNLPVPDKPLTENELREAIGMEQLQFGPLQSEADRINRQPKRWDQRINQDIEAGIGGANLMIPELIDLGSQGLQSIGVLDEPTDVSGTVKEAMSDKERQAVEDNPLATVLGGIAMPLGGIKKAGQGIKAISPKTLSPNVITRENAKAARSWAKAERTGDYSNLYHKSSKYYDEMAKTADEGNMFSRFLGISDKQFYQQTANEMRAFEKGDWIGAATEQFKNYVRPGAAGTALAAGAAAALYTGAVLAPKAIAAAKALGPKGLAALGTGTATLSKTATNALNSMWKSMPQISKKEIIEATGPKIVKAGAMTDAERAAFYNSKDGADWLKAAMNAKTGANGWKRGGMKNMSEFGKTINPNKIFKDIKGKVDDKWLNNVLYNTTNKSVKLSKGMEIGEWKTKGNKMWTFVKNPNAAKGETTINKVQFEKVGDKIVSSCGCEDTFFRKQWTGQLCKHRLSIFRKGK